jgi:signal transduction histidine kinase
VRSRLVLLIAIPTATAVALGASNIVSSWQSAAAYQRVERMASLSSKVTSLAFALESERDETVTYIALPGGGRASDPTGLSKAVPAQLGVVRQQIRLTDFWVAQVLAGIKGIGPGYPAQVRQNALSVQATLVSTVPSMRTAAVTTDTPALDVIQQYTGVVDDLLALDDQIDLNSADPQLAGTVQALSRISRIEEELSVQRGIVMDALTSGMFGPGMLTALNASIEQQTAYFADFTIDATPAQLTLYRQALAGSLDDRVNEDELNVIDYAEAHAGKVQAAVVPAEWFGDMSESISRVRVVEQDLVGSAVARANSLNRTAIITAATIGGAVILVLMLALLFTVIVGRSMVRPLRRLRAGALEVAGLRLPETVRRMSETDGGTAPPDVEPIDVDSSDEIGEVARAFDQVHREALRLAANEAALRGNVNAMFVNLSRRSQSLVERQIRLIDELEQGEQDPERLGSLFHMDHLATRMRRNSENLLVLAGHESSRRWNQPVPLVDVLRAAISEIEQYERVTLNVQPGIAVRGPAVNDVVHLIAELAENATSFSSADTPVSVSGHLLSSGGVLLDITDQGVGMGGEEMAHANWRLDNPPVVDVAVSRRMGLFVVARLAARHGIRVRLRPATVAGLTALVWLPDEVVVHEGAGNGMPSGFGRMGDQAGRSAIAPAGPAMLPAANWADSGRAAAENEVAAARMPRFAPLRPDSDHPPLGPPRVPGAGPRPGRAGGTTTGPLPAVGSGAAASNAVPGNAVPDNGVPGGYPGGYGDASRFGAGPQPAAANGLFGTGPEAGAGERFGTGPMPVIGPEQPVSSDWSGSSSGWPASASDPSPAAWPAWTAGGADAAGVADTFGTGAGAGAGAGVAAVAETAEVDEPAPPAWSPGGDQAAAFAWSGQSEQSVFSAPVASVQSFSGTFRTQDFPFKSADGEVIVPPAASLGEENRLPIFEAVESDWFRRGRPTVDWQGGQDEVMAGHAWATPVDDGWRAAEAAVVPASGGTTSAGLPRRVPQANLIPGTAAEISVPPPIRSAAATRERFASLQRGIREGRAASGSDRFGGTSNDVPSDG